MKTDFKWRDYAPGGHFLRMAERRDLLSRVTRMWLSTGNAFVCALAIAGTGLMILLYRPSMHPDWAMSAGTELFGILISVLIYFSYMQDPDSSEEHTKLFTTLIAANVLGLFLDECSWLVQGVAPLATVNRLCNTLLIINNVVIVYYFWLYSAYLLGIEAQTVRRYTLALRSYFVVHVAVLIFNWFHPLLFQVDAEGFYHRLPLLPLVWLSVLIVLIPIMRGFARFDGTKREKRVAVLFLCFPLVCLLVSTFNFGISMQYNGVLLSVILAIGVVISGRGKRMEAVRTELAMAHDIQQNNLPDPVSAFPDRREFEIFASMDPARDIGGDYYDFYLVDDDHLCLLIADVSDKGVPAALFMMSSKGMIKSEAMRGSAPKALLEAVNRLLCENNPNSMFVTVWLGILQISTGELTCVNAGHEFPVICRQGGAFRVYRDKHGVMVGATAKAKYTEYTLTLEPGDAIFVYTDGVPEAHDAVGGMYGMERLERALNGLAWQTPQDILLGVRADVDAFVDGAEQFDDLTMLCLRYRGPEAAQAQ